MIEACDRFSRLSVGPEPDYGEVFQDESSTKDDLGGTVDVVSVFVVSGREVSGRRIMTSSVSRKVSNPNSGGMKELHRKSASTSPVGFGEKSRFEII